METWSGIGLKNIYENLQNIKAINIEQKIRQWRIKQRKSTQIMQNKFHQTEN